MLMHLTLLRIERMLHYQWIIREDLSDTASQWRRMTLSIALGWLACSVVLSKPLAAAWPLSIITITTINNNGNHFCNRHCSKCIAYTGSFNPPDNTVMQTIIIPTRGPPPEIAGDPDSVHFMRCRTRLSSPWAYLRISRTHLEDSCGQRS